MPSETPTRAKEGELSGHGFDLTDTASSSASASANEHRQLQPRPRPEVPPSPLIPPPFTQLPAPNPPTPPQSDYYRHYLHPPPRPSTNIPPVTLLPTYPNTASTIAPTPRGTVPRPRPMSLPPQTFTPSRSGTSSDRTRQYVDQPQAASGSKHAQRNPDPPKSRTTNRILGDYTLSKTLGAGSMGKVKLAHHNITGEKVCTPSFLISTTTMSQPVFSSLHPSRPFLGIYRRIVPIAFRQGHNTSSERDIFGLHISSSDYYHLDVPILVSY